MLSNLLFDVPTMQLSTRHSFWGWILPGVKQLQIFGDSELIVNQIKDKCKTRHPRMRQYKNAVWDLFENFFYPNQLDCGLQRGKSQSFKFCQNSGDFHSSHPTSFCRHYSASASCPSSAPVRSISSTLSSAQSSDPLRQHIAFFGDPFSPVHLQQQLYSQQQPVSPLSIYLQLIPFNSCV